MMIETQLYDAILDGDAPWAQNLTIAKRVLNSLAADAGGAILCTY
ncbi:MAG: hypothetical protein ACXWKH_13640 [Limisphaerales bacterium]